jgi:type II restriction enzyme
MDAGYEAMCRAINAGRTPNLLALHYEPGAWRVIDLLLIPRFAFSTSCIQPRKALSVSARRRGHVLCKILLSNIPPDARIPVVIAGRPADPAFVRRDYARMRPLEELKAEARGWTLDVLNVVRGLGRREFSLAEVYAHESELARLHPGNRFVRPKIRQQLQILRDLGFVQFLGAGQYRTT